MHNRRRQRRLEQLLGPINVPAQFVWFHAGAADRGEHVCPTSSPNLLGLHYVKRTGTIS